MKPPAPFASTNQIRAAREAASLTQLELAHHLGVSRITVNRLESGQMAMQPHTALHLALLFAWLELAAISTAPAKSAKPKSAYYNSNSFYSFSRVEGGTLRLEEVKALPPGTLYRMQQDLRGWQLRERGEGLPYDDPIVQAGAALPDAEWLDATAKRFAGK